MSNGLQLYDKLLALPLFQGMNKGELSEMVEHIRIEFHRYLAGKTIVHTDDECLRLFFVLNGETCIMTESDDHSYRFYEDVMSPYIIQPERLFGLRPRYTHTIIAKTDCGCFSINKPDVMNMLKDFPIFRFNMFNFLSSLCQQRQNQLWKRHPKDLREQIVRFISMRCYRPAGAIEIKIKMEKMAAELNDSRTNVSKELNAMQADGLLILSRNKIVIPALEKLMM